MRNSITGALGAVFLSLGIVGACSGPQTATPTEAEIQAALASPLNDRLRGPNRGQLAFSSIEPSIAAEAAKLARENVEIDVIDQDKVYPVILQIGHYPRTRGSTGSQGQYINEQEGAALIVQEVSKHLDELGIEHVVIGADEHRNYQPFRAAMRFRADVFLSIHMDGATTPCRSGPSLGYNPAFGRMEMQLLGLSLANGLGADPRTFMEDNFTENLEHFYGYKHVYSEVAEGIVELTELTCPSDEENFLVNYENIAQNLAAGLHFMLKEL